MSNNYYDINFKPFKHFWDFFFDFGELRKNLFLWKLLNIKLKIRYTYKHQKGN